jgi:ppGpp synthetase/RelA/SpoT-type nucleotidyltranferase
MIGVRIGVQYPSSAESLVSSIKSNFRVQAVEDGSTVENINGLTAPLTFLTENPIGG